MAQLWRCCAEMHVQASEETVNPHCHSSVSDHEVSSGNALRIMGVECSGLKVILAADEHRPPVCELMRGTHEKSVFGNIPFSNAKLGRAFDNTLDVVGQHLALVVTLGNPVRILPVHEFSQFVAGYAGDQT